MKKLIFISALVISAIHTAKAQSEPPCNCYLLSGNITTNTALSQPCYVLSGCVAVQSGATLTIPAGTEIFAAANASLVVERGAYLIAAGTAGSPIVFTTNQAAGSRTPGYWKGITVAGFGSNNEGNPATLARSCSNISFGGNNNADSSGVLQYVQVHFAGDQGVNEREVNGLTLASVGSRTVIDHIQVTRSATDGIAFLGGAAEAKYLVTNDIVGNDITSKFGHVGMAQYGLLLRLDPASYLATGSRGLLSINNIANPTSIPVTQSVFSNFSLIGPGYCGATPNVNFEYGVYLSDNTQTDVYNTVVSGWRTGLRINGLTTAQNANNNLNLFFAYNTFYNNTTANFSSSTWPTGGCVSTMAAWVNLAGATSPSCIQPGNQALTLGTGYDVSICENEDFCADKPDFIVVESELSDPNYDNLDENFFEAAAYRGALQEEDWTAGWTEFCLQKNYCPPAPQRTRAVEQGQSLRLIPNPATGNTYAVFESSAGASGTVQLLDPVSGRVLGSTAYAADVSGTQRIAIDISSIKTGVYTVQILQAGHAVMHAQLIVP